MYRRPKWAKNCQFCCKGIQLAKDPDLCPNYLNIDDFTVDIKDATGLRSVKNSVTQVEEVIDDIEMFAGSEAHQSARLRSTTTLSRLQPATCRRQRLFTRS
ncbi:MAG: hypothetical protein LBG92_04525 [Prevotellaceae bacterium]|nr:hypothetical protein [Prevotellaceae bacterium]